MKIEKMPPDDGWIDFHEENLKQIKPAVVGEMVAVLKDKIGENLARVISSHVSTDPQKWWAPYHLTFGMAVRNWLRAAGYGESEIGIGNLDDVWAPLVERAVGAWLPGVSRAVSEDYVLRSPAYSQPITCRVPVIPNHIAYDAQSYNPASFKDDHGRFFGDWIDFLSIGIVVVAAVALFWLFVSR